MSQLFALARYTLLARLVGPEQLGLAATLILTQQFLESVSDSGSDRFLIQDAEGDKVEVQRLVQSVFVGRGVFTALALVVFAAPIAALYRAPALAGGLIVLAVSPLIFGFLHLDMRRAQRHNDFRAEGIGMLAAESASLIATVAAAYLTRSFTAVLYGLITRSLILVAVSHWRAERRYSLGFARDHASRLAKFAAPLMLNGLLLFVGSQGDRVVVVNRLGLVTLGHYSAVLMLITYPTLTLIRYVAAVELPQLSTARDQPVQRDRAADILGGDCLLMAVAMSLGFAIVAPWFVVVLYGAKFAQSAFVVALVGILLTSRILRLWPTLFALSLGASGTVLASNVARLVALPAAFAGVALLGGLRGVVIGFTGGELAAFTVAQLLLNRQLGRNIFLGFDRLAIFSLVSATILGCTLVIRQPSVIAVGALLGGSGMLLVWIARREAASLHNLVEIARRRNWLNWALGGKT